MKYLTTPLLLKAAVSLIERLLTMTTDPVIAQMICTDIVCSQCPEHETCEAFIEGSKGLEQRIEKMYAEHGGINERVFAAALEVMLLREHESLNRTEKMAKKDVTVVNLMSTLGSSPIGKA